MRLSVIVPIYKVEPYLRKCVDSLLRQDLADDEYEILLVDDGSPDGCGAICDSYASKYPNVNVIHRSNGGLSAARNTGIEVAKGKYVQFVDSDDYLEPDVLKALVIKAETDGLDVLRFNYQNVDKRYNVFEPNKVSKPFVDYRDEICDGLTFLTERLGFGCYAWQFLIRREILEGCRFKEGILFEDTEWTPRLLVKAQYVTSTDLLTYNYVQRIGSITQSRDEAKRRKALNDKIQLIDTMKKQKEGLSDQRWFEGMIAQLSLSIVDDISMGLYGERKQYLNELKSKKVLPLSDYHATPSARRKIRWVNASPELYCMVLHCKNRT